MPNNYRKGEFKGNGGTFKGSNFDAEVVDPPPSFWGYF